MKKFKLFALAVLVGTASLFATEGINPKEPKKKANKEIRTEIVQLLKAPDFAVNNDIVVTMTFTFSSEGELVVLNVDSGNGDVLDYIRENINYKKIEHPGERDKLYTMKLKVKGA